MNRHGALIAAGAMLLAGCTAVPSATPGGAPPAVRAPRFSTVGLERVVGHRAGDIVRLFGEPRLDVREGTGRKLQFVGPACVLDTYLYPQGNAEPVVTYVDARRSDGQSVDRAACVAALAGR